MNSTAQSAGINLLSSAESGSANNQKELVLKLGSSDNSLNSKDFSGVLSEQQAAQTVAASSQVSDAASDALRSDTALIKVMLVDSEGNAVAAIGKALPLATEQLPLATEQLPLAAEQLSLTAEQLPLAAEELPLAVSGVSAAEVATATDNAWIDASKLPFELMEHAEQASDLSENPLAIHTENRLSVPVETQSKPATVPVDTQSKPAANAANLLGAERVNIAATEAPLAEQRTMASKTAAVQPPFDLETGAKLATYSLGNTVTKAGSQANSPFAAALLASASQIQSRRSGESPAANALSIDAAEAVTKPNLSAAATAAEVNQAYKTAAQSLASVDLAKPGFSEAVMQRVMWMSSQQINRADIALDPPELGSLQVRVSTQADQTSVVFSSPHSAVREALDSGLSRLREMLEQQGLNLVDVDVSGHGAEQQHSDHSARSLTEDSGGEDFIDSSAEPESLSANRPSQHSLQLVDQYV